jgi:GT2 family glycosyltransferase
MKTLSLIIITFNRRADLLELLEDITRLENQGYLK